MKTKVEIDQRTAETLIAAGVDVECKFYMYVNAVVSEAAKKSVKRTPSPLPRAKAGVLLVVGQKKAKLQDMKRDLTPGLCKYISCILAYLMRPGNGEGATKRELSEMLIEEFPSTLGAGKNPIGTANTYVSRAYQLGILEEAPE